MLRACFLTFSLTLLFVSLIIFGFSFLRSSSRSQQAQTSATGESSDNSSAQNIDFQPGNLEADEKRNIQIYRKVNQSVVNISTETLGYNWFLEAVPQSGKTGSGSVIDVQGHILTNNHVVDKAYKIYVTLANNTQFTGKVIGSDPENDLSVIQIKPGGTQLKPIQFGNSLQLEVGQKVLAIGNPFGLSRTMTTGIISNVGRPLRNKNGLIMRNMIQTDASINPGNSGGPLLNSRGKMIGINTLIYSPSGGSVGIGFAVPIDTAKRVITDLIRYGEVKRGWIDIVPVPLFPALVHYANLPVQNGLLISEVSPNGNAARAGIKGGSKKKEVRSSSSVIYLGGDILTRINNFSVRNLADFYSALEDKRPGETVSVTVLRNKKKKVLKIKLSKRPPQKEI